MCSEKKKQTTTAVIGIPLLKTRLFRKGGFSKLLGLFSFTYSDQRNAQFKYETASVVTQVASVTQTLPVANNIISAISNSF